MPAAHSQTRAEREHHLAIVQDMYLRGRLQSEIARETGRSPGQISKDLKQLRVRWAELAGRHVSEELARVDAVEAEAWAAWERSKGPAQVRTSEKSARGQGEGATRQARETTREAESAGDPRYLDMVMKCVGERSKLLGHYKPLKVAPTDPSGAKPYAGNVVIYIPDNGRDDQRDPAAAGAAVNLPADKG